MEQILLIDKPAGITSFGVVAQVRRIVRQKVGHAGTLDPMATGLLVLGVGAGTKKLTEYLKLPKTYEATIRLGIRTDTSDIEGAVLEERTILPVAPQRAKETIEGLQGMLRLPVSAYSAIKREGEPLYKKARRGEEVTLPMRDMEIRKAEFLGLACEKGGCDIRARFDVGSGTYIRSLAEELGRRLEVPATLASLRRTRIGDFKIEDAVTLENLK